MNRAQVVNVKVPTDFGSLHFSVEHDVTCRVTRIDFKTHDSELTEDTQIGKLLTACTKGLNKAIEAMNEDWTHQLDLKAIAARTGQ